MKQRTLQGKGGAKVQINIGDDEARAVSQSL